MEFCSLDSLNPNSFWFAPQQYCVSWILLTTSASNAVTEGATLFCTYLTMGSTAQPVNSQVMPLLLWSSFQNKRQHNYIFPL